MVVLLIFCSLWEQYRLQWCRRRRHCKICWSAYMQYHCFASVVSALFANTVQLVLNYLQPQNTIITHLLGTTDYIIYYNIYHIYIHTDCSTRDLASWARKHWLACWEKAILWSGSRKCFFIQHSAGSMNVMPIFSSILPSFLPSVGPYYYSSVSRMMCLAGWRETAWAMQVHTSWQRRSATTPRWCT